MKKFELTNEFVVNVFGNKLFRVRALVAFGSVKAGEQGGYVEKEENLSQTGNAWVSDNARVSGNARVCDNARVSGNAEVYGDAWVSGNAWVYGDARVSGNARVYDNARVSGNAEVYGYAWVSGNAWVYGKAEVSGDAEVYGDAQVSGKAEVSGDAQVSGDARVSGNADYATVKGFGCINRNTTFFRCKGGKVRVVCGRVFGDLEEFRAIVKRTHGDGRMAKEYLAIADLMETHFKG